MFVHEIDLFKRQILGLERQVRKKPARKRLGKRLVRTSGTQKKVKRMQQKQVEPQMKNTLDSRPAEPGSVLTR